MILSRESTPLVVESITADKAGSKRLRISHLDAVGLCTAIMEKVPILIRTTGMFVKNINKPAPFHETKLCTSANMF